jgi:hypothetical protein
MAYKRFIDRPDVAFDLLKGKLEESHGKLVGDLKAQVATLGALENITRLKLPGMASDWRRIANDETFVVPVLRGSFFLPASNPVVESHLKKWHVPTIPNVTNVRSLNDALTNGHEINGILVENYYIGMLWYPKYSTAQSVVLLGIQLVKLGAAIAATVLSAGAASGSIVTTVSEGAATLSAVTNAAKSAGEVVSKGLEAREAYDGLAGQLSAMQNRPQSGLAGPRQGVAVDRGSLQDRDMRSAFGIDLSEVNRSAAGGLTAEQRAQDAERLSRMTFAVVQMIRPARSSIEGRTDFIESHDGGVSRILGLRYNAKMEVHRSAMVRIGPSKLEIVSGAAKSFHSMTQPDIESLLRPWDLRGIRDSGAEFMQFGATAKPDGTVADVTETGDLFDPNWDHGSNTWDDTGERHQVETRLPQKAIDDSEKTLAAFRQKFALMKLRNKGLRQWANTARANVQARQIAQQQAASFDRIALSMARRRLLPAAQTFLRETAETNIFGMKRRRSPYLEIVGELLAKTEALPDGDFRKRYVNLKLIRGTLENYSNQFNTIASPLSPVVLNLKAAVKAELAAIEASPGWMEAAIEDEFDVI